MKRIAVIGANGFVGSSIVREIKTLENVSPIPVLRGDDYEALCSKADFIIYTANPPSRRRAQQNPELDFKESVKKTFKFTELAKKLSVPFTLVSTISSRAQLGHVYGLNRAACELLGLKDNSLVIRLGYMYSRNRIYGALKELLEGEDVFYAMESRYSYSDVCWNAKEIIRLTLEEGEGIFELGAKGSISLGEIADILGSKSTFLGKSLDVQVAENVTESAPDIKEFVSYLRNIKKIL